MATSLQPLSVRLGRITAGCRAPLLALAAISVMSLAARGLMLGEPCQSPCTTADQHTLIFDEAYYVNAARVIAGIRPPQGSHYDEAPLGTDPNAEHPQGAKLVIAGAIELFGDGPFAWRIGSLLFGSLAILGMYALVRSGGGDRWPAVGAAALMSCDNLLLVHGRIGTLDIYALAPMIWGVALYMRGRPILAAIALAIADCMKEVAPYALVVLAIVELARVLVARAEPWRRPEWGWRPALIRLAVASVLSVALFIGLLGLMGLIATPYADAEAKLITGGPIAELHHMISYAAALTAPKATGIASYPWQWLLDLKPITYLRINPSLPGDGLYAIHPVSAFLGMMSPPIMLLAVPSLAFAAVRLLRRRRTQPDDGSSRATSSWNERPPDDRQLSILGVAWFLGTWGPYALQSAFDHRISYIYYMIEVMPGVYLAVSALVTLGWRAGTRWLRLSIALWAMLVLAAVILMYPFVAAF